MTVPPVPYLRLRQVIGLFLIGCVVYLSLTPHPIEVPGNHGDKYGHIVAYVTLMVWFGLMYRTLRDHLGLAIAFIGLGVGLEFMQRLTEYRTFDVADMGANALGVCLGLLVVHALASRRGTGSSSSTSRLGAASASNRR